MIQLVFRSADVYFQNLNNLNLRNIVNFILQPKEGEKGKLPERQRESVCERDRALLKMWLASILKMAVGERIHYFESSENQYIYCIEGIEMRQLGFKVRRLLFLNRY